MVFKQKISGKHVFPIVLLLIIGILSASRIYEYTKFDFNMILFLLVLPFIINKRNTNTSIRYGVASIVLLIIFLIFKLTTIYYFAIVCSLFYIYESNYGKLTNIPILLLLIISPVTNNISKVLGFEIRIWLTNWASKLLDSIFESSKSIGNIVLVNDNQFHIDPECMGLNMMILSLFVSIVYLSHFQIKNESRYTYSKIIITLILAFILSSISNFFRIILLVIFKSAPGTISHEVIGLFCFILYVVFPLYFIIKRIPSGKAITKPDKIINTYFKFAVSSVIVILLASINIANVNKTKFKDISRSTLKIDLKDYKCENQPMGILKLEKKDILMYIKPAVHFYSAEHSPIICWRGTGYKIENESIIKIGGKDLNFCTLSKGKDLLYSTWWYDSGDDKTNSQFRWRTQNLINQSDYRLVNVISHDKKILIDESKILLKKKIF